MGNLESKHFCITDPKDVKTVVYKLEETDSEFVKDGPKFTIKRLEYTSEDLG